ncbi:MULTISPECIES: type II toxin-antitoxin system RelE/ParE family toxin [Oscillatoriales]|uniref:type II toxin-antitoxin system RelE/ParE family toxin n=1 Tax=Oscillatoriophycideae TaxID=1301283 RepID=UPI001F557CAD|nr:MULTISPECIES: type II toxin-antitoxin system RelE/ParE family toxin [Oscillatoriales]
MQSEPPSIQINFAEEFKRNLVTLSKKYRHIRSDVQPIIERLEAGELLGDRISGTDYVVFKVRIKNSDIKKGKSGGYRLIYHVQTPTIIFLMTIYSKSEHENVSVDKIRRILSDVYALSEDEEETQDEKNGDRPSD